MINNRNQSTVRGMAWSSDGQQICIVYQDGAVIVGSVDGNRLWGKEFSKELAAVAWSPEARTILFGTVDGRVQVHNATGQYLTDLPLITAASPIVAIEWYDGRRGKAGSDAATLAIACANGSLQLMTSSSDPAPILVASALQVLVAARWSPTGAHLAIAGQAQDQSQLLIVYDAYGQVGRPRPVMTSFFLFSS